jgi:hypothetical protein
MALDLVFFALFPRQDWPAAVDDWCHRWLAIGVKLLLEVEKHAKASASVSTVLRKATRTIPKPISTASIS